MTEETKKEEVKEEPKPVVFSVDSLVGMKKAEAETAAKNAGYKCRVKAEDGVENMLSMDYIEKRANLVVKSGVVEKVSIG